MIESQQLPTPFFISSKPVSLRVEGVTSFVGILMEVKSSIFGLSIIRFEMQLLPLSLRRASGKLRFLKRWFFSRGQQLIVRFLPQITLYLMVALWQIIVVCAIVMQNLWITYYFFVQQLILYGCIYFNCLGSIESSQVQQQTYYFVGIIGLRSIVLIFGIWFQVVYCEPFGPNEINNLLRMRRKLWFSYQSFVNGPSLIGLVVGVSQIALPLWIFFRLLEQIRGCFYLFVSFFLRSLP